MKKLIAILLAVAMMASLATVASAAENTMVLKTTVPAASYTLSIPASLDIPFGTEEARLPLPEITETSGFEGRDLGIYISKMCPISDGTNSLQMSVKVERTGANYAKFGIEENQYMYYRFERVETPYWFINNDGTCETFKYLMINFVREDWAKLAPGEHTGYIEFTSEVVPRVMEG